MDNFNLKGKIDNYHAVNKPMTLICELCRQPYAIVYKEELKLPLTSDMFHSHLPPDVPDPFNAGDGNPPILWPDMWCIYGRKHKPFLTPDTLTLQGDGLFVVTDLVPDGESWVLRDDRPEQDTVTIIHTVGAVVDDKRKLFKVHTEFKKPKKPEPIKCRFCGDVFTAKTSKLRHETNSCKKRPRR